MALDPRIAMGVQPIQIEPQAKALMRALQIQGMMQQNALAKQQGEDVRQRRALEQQQMQNALMQQQGRAGYLNSLSGQAGPPEPFNVARALAAGLRPEEVKAIQGEEPKLMNVGPGGTVFDPRTKQQVFQAPFKPDAPPEVVRMMDFMNTLPANDPRRAVLQDAIRKQTTHAPGVSVSYGAPVAGQDSQGNPVFFQPSKDGRTPPAIVQGVQPPARVENMTEGQSRAFQFVTRMEKSDSIIEDLISKGTKASVPGSMRNDTIGDVLTALSSEEGKKLNQAKRDFINAALRRESGAVISPEEFANADRQYFPGLLDPPSLVKQKAENRRIAIEGIRADVPKNRQADVDRVVTPGAPKRIKTDAEYNALPSGATFIAPDGTTRRKP